MKGQPISQATLKDEIHAEISITPVLGLVSELHVIGAAKKANYRYFHEWQDLSWKQKAELVAHYFADRLLEQHLNAAISTEMEKRQRRARARSKSKK